MRRRERKRKRESERDRDRDRERQRENLQNIKQLAEDASGVDGHVPRARPGSRKRAQKFEGRADVLGVQVQLLLALAHHRQRVQLQWRPGLLIVPRALTHVRAQRQPELLAVVVGASFE